MTTSRWDRIGGPIRGLCLPFQAWEALREEGITTVDQLRAQVDQIHTLPGIGPKMAQLIREELARVTPSRKAPDCPPSALVREKPGSAKRMCVGHRIIR